MVEAAALRAELLVLAEREVHKQRHSIISCHTAGSETEEEEPNSVRKLFQARVQRLLAVQWFTKKPGVRIHHLRKHFCADEPPSQEEEVVLGKVLSNGHLMQKTTALLQRFQHEIAGVDGFFDELGVAPSWIPGMEDSPSLTDEKKEILMKLAVKAIHQAKWISLRICYNEYVKQQEQELKLLRQNYAKLKDQFADVRQDYLQEVATLRDQVRIRGEVDTAGWVDTSGGDVVYFFDPSKALTPKEADFVLLAVKEKLMMILEQNPRLGGAVDLGQLDKLRELKENKEMEEMRAELVRRSHELNDTQKALRAMQEANAQPIGVKSKWDVIVQELEDKVSQLRHDMSNLKHQLHAESKERQQAEKALNVARIELEELQGHLRDLEEQDAICQSEVRAVRTELEAVRAQNLELQGSERAAKAKLDSMQESCNQLRQLLRRKLKSGSWEDSEVREAYAELDLPNAPSHPSEERCEEVDCNAELIAALEEKDQALARAEDLRRENSQLRRSLAKQSQGILLLEAESSCQNANELQSFMSSLQQQLQPSKQKQPAFPDLEHELAEASEEAAESLKALLEVLRRPPEAEAEKLQRLQEESQRCQEHKQRLEQELFRSRFKQLNERKGGKADAEKLQGMLASSLDFVESMSRNVQQLAAENATLRQSLLSFSSNLSQASSLAPPDVEGDEALQGILSSIKSNAECAVPAVFSRLFNDSRGLSGKTSSRLERAANERRESLMRSLVLHLSEDADTATGDARWREPRSLRHGSSENLALEEATAHRHRGLVKHRSSMEHVEEPPLHRLKKQSSMEDLQDPCRSRPLRTKPQSSFLSQDSGLSLRCESEVEECQFDLSARSAWSRQCFGNSEVSVPSSQPSKSRMVGITSLEFRPELPAAKARPRRKEGFLPHVAPQVRRPSTDFELCRSGESSDLYGSGDESEREASKPLSMARAGLLESLEESSGAQTHRETRQRLLPPESWQSRMRSAFTTPRRLTAVGKAEPPRSRRASVS